MFVVKQLLSACDRTLCYCFVQDVIGCVELRSTSKLGNNETVFHPINVKQGERNETKESIYSTEKQMRIYPVTDKPGSAEKNMGKLKKQLGDLEKLQLQRSEYRINIKLKHDMKILFQRDNVKPGNK